MKKPSGKKLQSYQPSEDLARATSRLLGQYPLEEMQKRLVALSRGLNRDGEFGLEQAQSLGDTYADATQQVTASGDLLEILGAIKAVAENKAFQRDAISEEGNAYLLLFDRFHPAVDPKILKCLDSTSQWIDDQMNVLDDRATALAAGAKDAPSEEREALIKRITFIDETAGMLYLIKEWAQVAVKEMDKAQNPEKPKGRAA